MSVARLFATVSRVAEARVRNIGRRAALRAALIGGCVLAALLCLGFALIAATVALADRFGTINALAIMAGGALVVLLILLAALAWEDAAAPPPRRPARGARPPARPGGGALARGGRAAVAAGDRARAGGARGAHGAAAAGSRLRRAGRCSRSPRTTRTAASCWSRSGSLRKADLDALTARFDAKVAAGGPVPNLVIQSPSFPTWSNFAALMEHLRFIRGHHRQIEKVALVSDARALDVAPRIARLFVSARLRHFPGRRARRGARLGGGARDEPPDVS